MHQGSSEGGTEPWKPGQNQIAEATLLGPTVQSLGKPIPGNQQRAQITGHYQIAQPSPPPHGKLNAGKPSDLTLACFPGTKGPLT